MAENKESKAGRPLDLLLVDDDDELREDMSRFFSRRGYNVSECAGGDQALAFTDQRAFDVIILDMMMPGMSGLDLLEKLGQRGTDSEVVMLTGQGTIETAVEAINNQQSPVFSVDVPSGICSTSLSALVCGREEMPFARRNSAITPAISAPRI